MKNSIQKNLVLCLGSVIVFSLAGCKSAPNKNDVGDNVHSLDIASAIDQAQKTKVVREYVPIPIPGQLMPIDTSKDEKAKVYLTKKEATQEANKTSLQFPKSESFFNSMMQYDYMPGAVYTIYTAPMRLTDISFEAGESIISIAAGDTYRWRLSKTYSNSEDDRVEHILVKPTSAGISNNLIITTDQRVYHLLLQSTTNDTYMVSVAWNYEQGDSIMHFSSSNDGAGDLSSINIDISKLDFHYDMRTISGSKPLWYPVRVFNDGYKTYIEFSKNFHKAQLPMLMALDKYNNLQTMQNWRLKGRFLIIDAVLEKMHLVTGVNNKHKTVVELTLNHKG